MKNILDLFTFLAFFQKLKRHSCLFRFVMVLKEDACILHLLSSAESYLFFKASSGFFDRMVNSCFLCFTVLKHHFEVFLNFEDDLIES